MPPPTMLLDSGSLPASPALLRSLLLGSVTLDGIEVVLWPAEEDRRARFVDAGVPCLLILDAEVAAPVCGALEDWVRPPVTIADIDARCRALRARVSCAAQPEIDPNGALWYDGERVDLPLGQQPLAQLLIDHYQSVVRREDLLEVYVEAGGRRSEEALKAALVRLGRRLKAVGLVVRSLRGRGCLLEPIQRCGAAPSGVTDASDPAL